MPFQEKLYRRLRKHLDTMPVGYPSTRSGVELKILKHLFTPDETRVAVHMTHEFDTAVTIGARARKEGISPSQCELHLREMASQGSILRKEEGAEFRYALIPYSDNRS